jgi:glucose-1-phosphate adenylyltransferase
MHLVGLHPPLDLGDERWPIRTQTEVRHPARIATGASVSRSILSEGCVVGGTVEGSILSPGVHVARNAVVRSAVVMHNTAIKEGALVERAILDSDVVVGPHARVGQVDRDARIQKTTQPERLAVVAQGTQIPARAVVAPDDLIADRVLAIQHEDLSETPARVVG